MADLCRRDGCTEVRRVGRTGDDGADVRGRLPDGRTMVIQCKRYQPKQKISNGEVRNLLGSQVHFKAEVALFVTTTYFSGPAERCAVQLGVPAGIADRPEQHQLRHVMLEALVLQWAVVWPLPVMREEPGPAPQHRTHRALTVRTGQWCSGPYPVDVLPDDPAPQIRQPRMQPPQDGMRSRTARAPPPARTDHPGIADPTDKGPAQTKLISPDRAPADWAERE
ncbi:restriction endonuclease [Streptomyces sp. NPDC002082]|uniref:restriction endonuclease n=1 Tax=Streptomyces sp. NPDC002082 TaxID=3154772 RepID=UPI0033174BEC